MSHPQQFDDSDPVLAQVREICLGLPGADEKISHGRPNFFTKKTFTIYGAVVKGDHHSGRYDQAIIVLPDPDELVALKQDERFFTPAYYGPSGWIGVDLSGDDIDWDEVAELIQDSFRNTALKRLVKELDERGDS